MAMSDVEKLYLLKNCSVFEDLTPEALNALVEKAVETEIRQKHSFIRQKEKVTALYYLLHGKLGVEIDGARVAEIDSGSLIGDHEILLGIENAAASVVVVSNYARFLMIPRDDFIQLLDSTPEIKLAFIRAFGARAAGMEKAIQHRKTMSGRIECSINKLNDQLDNLELIAEEVKNRRQSTTTIERRFIILVDPKKLPSPNINAIDQSYIAVDKSNEIRLRQAGDKYTITGKGKSAGDSIKIEIDLQPALYDALVKHPSHKKLAKVRYELNHNNAKWRIDVFDNDSTCPGLMLAEVDLPQDSNEISFPPGVTQIREITGDDRYRNRNLAVHGLPEKY